MTHNKQSCSRKYRESYNGVLITARACSMDYFLWNIVWRLSYAIITIQLIPGAFCWQKEWRPNYFSVEPEYMSSKEVFDAGKANNDSFHLLRVEGDRIFIGTRNRVYHLQFGNFQQLSTLEWAPDSVSTSTCSGRGKKECDNYIRVLMLKNESLYYICGTHAYQPRCRHYTIQENGEFKMTRTENDVGTGISPFNPNHNSTAIYVDGKIFAATVSDADERDPLILQKVNDSVLVRTITRDSIFLNEPNFVSSFDKNDKVFFFFRETSVENINCGKAVFSRVARVCKNDRGSETHQNTFTSFFKARLNCSIPGEYPFYFDEIQSTTEFGQGNYKPTSDSGDRSDMIYGIFNTPENGIRGSAVCAFAYSDIDNTFKGRFKGQESYLHNWLPVGWDETPKPQPVMCTSDSQQLSYSTLNFIKKHPLMDDAVPALGRRPMLVFTSFKSKFTQIAVDWQVLAADGKYYDVMFVGTDDGRVIKAINKGTHKIESVVIEDIQVLDANDPVVSLKVLSGRADKHSESLVVMSKQKVVSIPLHRCSRATTCSACVALQDPYCVWNENLLCINAQSGLQNISSGKHSSCKDEPTVKEVTTTPTPLIEPSKCSCLTRSRVGTFSEEIHDASSKDKPTEMPLVDTTKEEVEGAAGESHVAAAKSVPDAGVTLEVLIISVIVSIIVSLIAGFFIGFKLQSCRYNRERDSTSFYDRNYSSLQRGRNRLSSGDNPYFHSLTPKQLNHVVNLKSEKTNTGVETKPVTKSNKVYL